VRRILVNYADGRFYRAQRKNAGTGLAIAGFDECRRFRRNDLDDDFARRFAHILRLPRGAGYWLWKPYILLKALESASEGDFVAYADAGSVFTAQVAPLAAYCLEATPRLAAFDLGALLERQFTKRDAFVLLDCDRPHYADTPQLMASFVATINNAFSRSTARAWLRLACDPQLLTDLPNTCGLPDYPDFRAHRHDQSIFSLLYKRKGLAAANAVSDIDISSFLTITRKDPGVVENLLGRISQRQVAPAAAAQYL
jgi:hypothetical protein